MESVYWVFTHNCNLRCAHCYNWSRPGAPTISQPEADAVLGHLPAELNRFILSGGEPVVELEAILARYRSDPLWEALNRGDPAGMGLDREHAERRIRELGSVCLWCDEFFRERAQTRGQTSSCCP